MVDRKAGKFVSQTINICEGEDPDVSKQIILGLYCVCSGPSQKMIYFRVLLFILFMFESLIQYASSLFSFNCSIHLYFVCVCVCVFYYFHYSFKYRRMIYRVSRMGLLMQLLDHKLELMSRKGMIQVKLLS